MYRSETSKFRDTLLPFCTGTGVDMGYGGDPIRPEAITLDLQEPYAVTGHHPQNLQGDARNLFWFRSDVFDYVYSSHLLEDFADKKPILEEWIRVLKPGGNVVLLLPDEKRFRAYCKRTDMPYNDHHADDEFSIETMKSILEGLPVTIIKELPVLKDEQEGSDYNFAIVAQKDAE